MTVGVVEGYFDQFMVREVERNFDGTIDKLRSLGMKIRKVLVPHIELMSAVQLATSRVENVAAHDRYLRARSSDYSR